MTPFDVYIELTNPPWHFQTMAPLQTYITQRSKETLTHTLSYLLTTPHLTPLKPQIIYRVFDLGPGALGPWGYGRRNHLTYDESMIRDIDLL